MTPHRESRARPQSAGILLYRQGPGGLQVLLVHPGGPIWARRDLGAWSIPKGEYADDERALAAARREFEEELGSPVPAGDPLELGEIRQKSGKYVRVWAVAGDLDTEGVKSNEFEMEWPPRSGKRRRFPEVDRAEWFDLPQAGEKVNAAQVPLLQRLEELVAASQQP